MTSLSLDSRSPPREWNSWSGSGRSPAPRCPMTPGGMSAAPATSTATNSTVTSYGRARNGEWTHPEPPSCSSTSLHTSWGSGRRSLKHFVWAWPLGLLLVAILLLRWPALAGLYRRRRMKRHQLTGIHPGLTPKQHETLLALSARTSTLHSSSVKALRNRGLAREIGAFTVLTQAGREYIQAGTYPLRRRKG